MSISIYRTGSYRLVTRDLVKSNIRRDGWLRLNREPRPDNYQEIMVAREHINKDYGVTDEFLITYGEYSAKTDSILPAIDALLSQAIPFSDFQWWKPVWNPAELDVLKLHVGNIVTGIEGRFCGMREL